MRNSSSRMASRLRSITEAQRVVVHPLRTDAGRGEDRLPTYRHGRLLVASGVEIPCSIVDASESGARVQLDGASGLPDFVVLKIAATGMTKRARVVWKRNNAAGLSFKIEQMPGFAAPCRNNLTPRSSPAPDDDRKEGE